MTEIKYWIGVVSKEHVLIGVKAGIAQIGHVKKSGLARMHKNDWFIYYSPKIALDSKIHFDNKPNLQISASK